MAAPPPLGIGAKSPAFTLPATNGLLGFYPYANAADQLQDLTYQYQHGAGPFNQADGPGHILARYGMGWNVGQPLKQWNINGTLGSGVGGGAAPPGTPPPGGVPPGVRPPGWHPSPIIPRPTPAPPPNPPAPPGGGGGGFGGGSGGTGGGAGGGPSPNPSPLPVPKTDPLPIGILNPGTGGHNPDPGSAGYNVTDLGGKLTQTPDGQYDTGWLLQNMAPSWLYSHGYIDSGTYAAHGGPSATPAIPTNVSPDFGKPGYVPTIQDLVALNGGNGLTQQQLQAAIAQYGNVRMF